MSNRFLLLPFVSLVLQAQIQVPQLGSIRCADGSVRPVYGVPAAFVLGKPVFSGTVSASFSGRGGIVATRDAIYFLDAAGNTAGERKASDPGALVGIETDLSSAIAWLPGSSSLLYWDAGTASEIELSSRLPGRVLELYRDGSRAVMLILEDGGGVSENEVSLSSGDITSVKLLAGLDPPTFRQAGYALIASITGIQIEGPSGIQTIPLAASGLSGNVSMEMMAPDWVHLMSTGSGRHWALHLLRETSELFELPGISQLGAAK